MERVANKARGFDAAREWDVAQYAAMTPDERRAVAKALRERLAAAKKQTKRQRPT
jgi:predicted Fe-S protein YdhL (DUF1289 family)